jgi:hypothetical protein
MSTLADIRRFEQAFVGAFEHTEGGGSQMTEKLRSRADQDEVILALRCGFEWVSRDFGVTESDGTE